MLKPGRPSNRYLLRGSSRRGGGSCDQPVAPVEPVEQQLVAFVADFKPGAELRDEILHRLADTSGRETADVAKQRTALEQRLRRMRDLYELGDLDRPAYLARRDAIHAELADLAPDPLPDLEQARKVLDDFGIFWRLETDPDAKRQLLGLLFEKVWLDERRVVAVQPKPAFASFFRHPHRKPLQKGVQRAGATGLEPATSGVTGRRSNRLSYAPNGWGRKYGMPWRDGAAGSLPLHHA
jgi:hypothetical protein